MKSEKYDDFEKYIRQSLKSSFEEDGPTVSDELFNRTLSAIRNLEAEDKASPEEEEKTVVAPGKSTEQAQQDKASKKKIYRLIYAASGIAAAVLIGVIGIGIVSGNNRMKSSDTAAYEGEYSTAEEGSSQDKSFGSKSAVREFETIEAPAAMEAAGAEEPMVPMSTPAPDELYEHAAAEVVPAEDETLGTEGNALNTEPDAAFADGQGGEDVIVNTYPEADGTGEDMLESSLVKEMAPSVLPDPSGTTPEDGMDGKQEVELGDPAEEMEEPAQITGNLGFGIDSIVEDLIGVRPENFKGKIHVIYEEPDSALAGNFRDGVAGLQKTATAAEPADAYAEVAKDAGRITGNDNELVVIFNSDMTGTVYLGLNDGELFISNFNNVLVLQDKEAFELGEADGFRKLVSKLIG